VSREAAVTARRELYYERKLAGLCTRCGAAAAEDSQLCPGHQLEARIIMRRTAQERRQARRDAGLCAYCGKVKSDRYACAGCTVRRQSYPPTKNVNVAVNSNTAVWRHGTTSRDATTLRYHGRAVRGAPPASVTDEADCKQISAEVERARRGLEYAHSAEVAELPRIQRKEARHAALSRLALAKRYIEEVLQRHKYEDSSE
jgi:hypothetical protein